MTKIALKPAVTFVMPYENLPELRKVLNRAMNTWDPKQQPHWLAHFSEQVDAALAPPEPDLGVPQSVPNLPLPG